VTKRKRQSEPKRGSSNPSPPDLFVDRSLGRRKIPDRLREVHPVVIVHDDLFPQDADDEVWLEEAGRRRWIVLTKDEGIRRKPGEQQAIVQFGARCFVLHPTKEMTAEEMARILVARFRGSLPPPAMTVAVGSRRS
jgi:PIN like domain